MWGKRQRKLRICKNANLGHFGSAAFPKVPDVPVCISSNPFSAAFFCNAMLSVFERGKRAFPRGLVGRISGFVDSAIKLEDTASKYSFPFSQCFLRLCGYLVFMVVRQLGAAGKGGVRDDVK